MITNKSQHKNLLDVIDFEINKINFDDSRAGWNFWFLLGGISSLGLVLLQEIEKGNQIWERSLLFFLILSLIYDLHGIFGNFLNTTNNKQSTRRFFVASTSYGTSRTILLFLAFKNLMLCFIILYLKNVVPFYKFILVFYITFTFSILLVLFFSFSNMPLRSSPKKTWARLVSLIFLIGNIYTLVLLLIEIISGNLVIQANEYRIGALVFGIVYLISNILKLNINTHQKDVLNNIRRDFLLEKIKFEEAKRQTEVLLLGMQADDFVQEEVIKIIDLINLQTQLMVEGEEETKQAIQVLTVKNKKLLQVDKFASIVNSTMEILNNTYDKLELALKLNSKIEIEFNKLNQKTAFIEKGLLLQSAFHQKIKEAQIKNLEKNKTLIHTNKKLKKATDSLIKKVKPRSARESRASISP